MCIIALGWGYALASCQALDKPGGDPRPLIPADASPVVVITSLEEARERGVSLLAGITGASGLLDLLHARSGVDLLDADGLRRAGLEPHGALVLFRWQDALGAAAGVVHSGRFDALAEERITRGFGGQVVPLPGERRERVADLPEDRGGGAVAWGTTPGQVGLVVWAPNTESAIARWRTLSAGAGGYLVRPEIRAIRDEIAGGALAWAVVEAAPSLPGSPGPVGAAAVALVQGLTRWSAVWTADGQGLSIEVVGRWMDKGGLPADWLHGKPLSTAITRRLPQSTTAFVRLRLNSDRLRLVPGWLRDRFLPSRLPGPLGEVLPATGSLLDQLGDEVGFGVLGLDESATVETLANGMSNPRLLAQLVHIVMAMRLQASDSGPALVTQVRESLRAGGWQTAEVNVGGWTGISAVRSTPPQVWSVLTSGDVFLVASGAGEVERLRALAEGRALPLMAETEAPPAARVAHGRLGFTRLTRELADKGVPPYFLEMLNDLRRVDLSVDVATDRLGIRLELEL